MTNKKKSLLAIFITYSSLLTAQVQVSKEPHHHKIIENKYFRLLDVRIKPGDTTLFHIHSTPSLFIQFTSNAVGTQIKGREWTKDMNQKGKSYYRSFLNDTLVHRVSNFDTIPFHVNDIELLSAYKSNTPYEPLPFTVLFDNEKVMAYRLNASSFDNEVISKRGPMIAELVDGEAITYYDALKKKSTILKNGESLYIEPGSAFYFIVKTDEEINLVLFEIK